MAAAAGGAGGRQLRSPRDGEQKRRSINGVLAMVLLLIVVARLGLALLVYARPELAIANDSDRYIPIANAILKGTAYAWTTTNPGELLNTAGYPLFLAAVFGLVGSGAGDIALAQLALSGAMALGLYLLLAGRIGAPAAFLGAVLLAVDPLTALWSMTVLTEALFGATLGFAAGSMAAWTHDQRLGPLALAGLCVALACLVKPFALLVAALWAVSLMFFPGESIQGGRSAFVAGIRRAAVFGLPIILLIGPWFIRNALLWDCPALSSVDRVTMRDYVAAKVLSEANHVGLAEAQAELQAADPGVCPDQAAKYWGIIMANPGIYARLHAAGTVPVLIATNFDRWMQYFGQEYVLPDLWRPFLDGGLGGLGKVMFEQLVQFPQAIGLMLGLSGFQMMLYGLAFVGGIAAFQRPEGEFKWICITLLTTMAILVLTPGQGGHERFRVPVQPMLAILISYGVAARRGVAARPHS